MPRTKIKGRSTIFAFATRHVSPPSQHVCQWYVIELLRFSSFIFFSSSETSHGLYSRHHFLRIIQTADASLSGCTSYTFPSSFFKSCACTLIDLTFFMSAKVKIRDCLRRMALNSSFVTVSRVISKNVLIYKTFFVKTGEKPYLCKCSIFAMAAHAFWLKDAYSRLKALLKPVSKLTN